MSWPTVAWVRLTHSSSTILCFERTFSPSCVSLEASPILTCRSRVDDSSKRDRLRSLIWRRSQRRCRSCSDSSQGKKISSRGNFKISGYKKNRIGFYRGAFMKRKIIYYSLTTSVKASPEMRTTFSEVRLSNDNLFSTSHIFYIQWKGAESRQGGERKSEMWSVGRKKLQHGLYKLGHGTSYL